MTKIYVVTRALFIKDDEDDKIGRLKSKRNLEVFNTKEEAVNYIKAKVEKRKGVEKFDCIESFLKTAFELEFSNKIVIYQIDTMKLA